jgi:hypothetical protein
MSVELSTSSNSTKGVVVVTKQLSDKEEPVFASVRIILSPQSVIKTASSSSSASAITTTTVISSSSSSSSSSSTTTTMTTSSSCRVSDASSTTITNAKYLDDQAKFDQAVKLQEAKSKPYYYIGMKKDAFIMKMHIQCGLLNRDMAMYCLSADEGLYLKPSTIKAFGIVVTENKRSCRLLGSLYVCEPATVRYTDINGQIIEYANFSPVLQLPLLWETSDLDGAFGGISFVGNPIMEMLRNFAKKISVCED